MFRFLSRRGRKPRQPAVVERQVQIVHVLSYEQYRKLEASLPGTNLAHGESGEQYAFNLGVAHTLRVIREGFTVDPTGEARYHR